MAEKLEGNIDISKIKRCYVEDTKIEIECECGKELEHDFSDQYLMYPQPGTIENCYFHCEQCDTEWNLPVTIVSAVITLEYDLKELEKE